VTSLESDVIVSDGMSDDVSGQRIVASRRVQLLNTEKFKN
jgi:hypothetical protein